VNVWYLLRFVDQQYRSNYSYHPDWSPGLAIKQFHADSAVVKHDWLLSYYIQLPKTVFKLKNLLQIYFWSSGMPEQSTKVWKPDWSIPSAWAFCFAYLGFIKELIRYCWAFIERARVIIPRPKWTTIFFSSLSRSSHICLNHPILYDFNSCQSSW